MKRAKKREYKRRFYDIWTKKEAYLKKKGTGISDNLKKVNVTKKYDFITFEWNNYYCSVTADGLKTYSIKIIQFEELIHFLKSFSSF
ncbi:4'-phosphopantetheinyl transferase superfamily protein [Staphylococcus lugdunensis]|nr:4'-phosphopantetheinyl transferase superfamily protein [Staphylococcus lugdunensis]MCH8647465.1 4'-phosphopantetheinyl transferase superfamily protein [Staphylococcus lugdunensis]MCH8659951.1 4'-phosphopantetheinyl transferase superfamily protein [Staphylococcus lugdunensis]MCH8668345.1 4'-phosphopantetheinyl transferase superfamily protein [Staphylococcus lugdunensis]SQE71200.1 Uncharacterised protein [Staphylococcus lugdunensis]